MQITTTMKYNFTQVRMATIKNPTNNKRWRPFGEKETSIHIDENVNLWGNYGEQYGGS